jgi:PPOX class probable F420-dependent enzyme
MQLPDSAREVIEAGALGHLVTIAPSGAPQVTCIWVAVRGDHLETAHMNPGQQKLRNVARDPRVVLSFESGEIRAPGLREYLVVHGRAQIVPGGAPELLRELARVYLGPQANFPPGDDPPAGVRMRIAVERVGGIGPWAD